MEFDFEVQYGPGSNNMVADSLSPLQSDHKDESFSVVKIPERYVEYVESTFLVHTVSSAEGNAPHKLMIDNLVKE